MDLLIPQELAQAVVNYLVTRPYRDVHLMVPELIKLQPPKQEADPKEAA